MRESGKTMTHGVQHLIKWEVVQVPVRTLEGIKIGTSLLRLILKNSSGKYLDKQVSKEVVSLEILMKILQNPDLGLEQPRK